MQMQAGRTFRLPLKLPSLPVDTPCNNRLKRYAEKLKQSIAMSDWKCDSIYEKLPEKVACWILGVIDRFDFNKLTFDNPYIKREKAESGFLVSVSARCFVTNKEWGLMSQWINREEQNGRFVRCSFTVRVARENKEGHIILLYKACNVPRDKFKLDIIKEKTDWRW